MFILFPEPVKDNVLEMNLKILLKKIVNIFFELFQDLVGNYFLFVIGEAVTKISSLSHEEIL